MKEIVKTDPDPSHRDRAHCFLFFFGEGNYNQVVHIKVTVAVGGIVGSGAVVGGGWLMQGLFG